MAQSRLQNHDAQVRSAFSFALPHIRIRPSPLLPPPRPSDAFLVFSRTSKIKELKSAIANKFGLDPVHIKLLIKGSSSLADSSRICDISGLSSPVLVTVLAASLTSVSVEDIDRKKYEHDAQVIQVELREAAERASLRSHAMSHSSIAQLALERPNMFHNVNDFQNNDLEEGGRTAHAPAGKLAFDLQLFSGACLPIGHPPSEFSNQITLPSRILQSFTQEEVPFPIVLEISRIDSLGQRRITHVIPGEYQNRIDAAYAPYQVLQDLGSVDEPHHQIADNKMDVDSLPATASSSSSVEHPSSSTTTEEHPSPTAPSSSTTTTSTSPFPTSGEGMLVSFRTVQLPKGTTATLKPLEFDWLIAVPEEQQKPVLEDQLRRYLCLSLNDTIKVQHGSKTFKFKVVALEPAPAVSLSSTDLAVDILIPQDSPTHSNLTLSINGSSPIPSNEKHEHQSVLSIKKDESRYFQFEISDPNQALILEVESVEGFPPSMYVCTRRPYPTASDHMWSSDNMSGFSERQIRKLQQTGRRRIILSQDDPQFALGRFYVGIHAPLAASSFILRTIVGLKSEIVGGSFAASGARASGSLLSSSGAEIPPNSTQCHHCSHWIPNATLTMHQIQCARRNWVCPSCHFVCPIGEKEKHMSIAHAVVKCECGFESEGDLVALHREFECHLRPFQCPFCNLSMPYGKRSSHLTECGSRTSQCPTCQAWVKNNDLAVHQLDLHPTSASSPPMTDTVPRGDDTTHGGDSSSSPTEREDPD